MDVEDLKRSLHLADPPNGLSAELRALWLDAKGRWEDAHAAVQDEDGAQAAWVHAYLHRKEGDRGNAAYWYRTAQRKMPDLPLDEEWEAIVRALLTAA